MTKTIKSIEKKNAQRRLLRSKYAEIRTRISEMSRLQKFITIVNEVENLHQHVKKPREQVADAEALLDLSKALADAAKSHITGYITPSEFLSSLYRCFGEQNQSFLSRNGANLLRWRDIGLDVAHIFKHGRGCLNMTGAMNSQIKRRKFAVRRRKHTWLGSQTRPKKVNKRKGFHTDTEKNIYVMFEILKFKYPVKLEYLILNRHSFSQTVENLFALSFLVKDGLVAVHVDQSEMLCILPKIPPASELFMSERAESSQFIFRLYFKDWKEMLHLVPKGEELMPHRESFDNSDMFQQPNTPPSDTVEENKMANDTPEDYDATTATPKCMRKLRFLIGVED